MSEKLKAVLDLLAAGEIDAAEAARRIAAAKHGTDSTQSPDLGHPPSGDADGDRRQYSPHAREVISGPSGDSAAERDAPPAARTEAPRRSPRTSGGVNAVGRVMVHATGRVVRITADPDVAALSAEGPHVLRRTNGSLEVTSDGDIGPSLEGFSFIRPPRSLDDLRSIGLGKALTLRINPALELDVEVTGGWLTCSGMPSLGKVRVTAGSAQLKGVHQVSDVLVQAGHAIIEGAIDTGRSRLRVESGQLTISLAAESNVTVRGEAQLGRIVWPEGAVDEYVIGNGSARLDVGVVMGQARIKVADEHGNDDSDSGDQPDDDGGDL